MKKLSVIVPAFNEESTIKEIISQLNSLITHTSTNDTSVEIIVVSDGSTDATFEIAKSELELQQLNGSVIKLLKNVGSHKAIRCGISVATGDVIVMVSADGQDPIDTIPLMLDQIQIGFDVVWGERIGRAEDSVVTRIIAYIFYAVFRTLTGMDIPRRGLDYVMISKRVADELKQYKERNLAIHLAIFNLGYRSTSIQYARLPRKSGQSKWTMRKRIKLALDMFSGSSLFLLRLVIYTGVIIGASGFTFGLFTFIRAIVGDTGDLGWASLMSSTSIIGGLALVALGVIGEYLGRTLDEVKAQPLYVVDRIWNTSNE